MRRAGGATTSRCALGRGERAAGLGRRARHLATHGISWTVDPPPRQFAGGLANLNYLDPRRRQAGRAAPPAAGRIAGGRHDMAREHRILSRLPDALPFVPRGLFLCADPSVIGAPFQIIEYRPGLVIREHLPPELAGRPEVGARLSQVLLETIAAIHAVDTAAVGLDDLGRPDGSSRAPSPAGASAALAAKEDGTEALHADLGAWLETHLVPDGTPALLHNDFKLNNMILDPRDLSPVAVVDWDQGTRGDPLFDFATLLSYWVQPDDPPAMHDMAQMPADEARLLPARAGGGALRRADRARHVRLPVPSRAGDVQARRDLPAARPIASAPAPRPSRAMPA